jgi:predicted dehydrogenase
MGKRAMIKIGLIGFGYWGPNLARNFSANPDIELSAICDFSNDRLARAKRFYPRTLLCNTAEEFFAINSLDAIAIATPVATHYELAKMAIESGRHVWLEKPMTESVAQAERLIELAHKHAKTLLVDHTFVYTSAVRKIKQIIDRGELGKPMYYDSTRVNLGLFQQDINVIWDLAPHDISIMDYVIPFRKQAVSATGLHFFGNGLVPKSLLTIYLEGNLVAHINVSWVSPVKIRQTLIGGTAKMIVYDDTQPSEKVKIYDKGVELDVADKEEIYQLKVQYRVGDMYSPKLEDYEALALETEHFVDCVANKKKPLTGGREGLEVVKVLVAAQESLEHRGLPVGL